MSATRRRHAVGTAWLCTAALVAGATALYRSELSHRAMSVVRAPEVVAAIGPGPAPSGMPERPTHASPSSHSATPALRTSADFRTVRPGQSKGEIRKALGRPTTLETYPIKDEEIWSWQYVEAEEHLAFRVIFSEDDLVIWAGTTLWSAVDMSAPEAADPSESAQAPGSRHAAREPRHPRAEGVVRAARSLGRRVQLGPGVRSADAIVRTSTPHE